MPIAICPCGQKNRLKPGRSACGRCGHIFTDAEVAIAALGTSGIELPPEEPALVECGELPDDCDCED